MLFLIFKSLKGFFKVMKAIIASSFFSIGLSNFGFSNGIGLTNFRLYFSRQGQSDQNNERGPAMNFYRVSRHKLHRKKLHVLG